LLEIFENYGDVMNEAKMKKEKIEHLNLVLSAIRNINRLIVREKDRNRLIKGVCDNLIENRGYHNAWIVLFDESGELLTTAEAGLGDQFNLLIAHLRKGELTGCARKALSQSDPVATVDPISECPDCPLSSGYAGRGAMTVRLEHEGRNYGIASVSVQKNLATDKEEKGLLKEVAGDVAFALHSLELDEKYKRASDEYRTIFETTGTATIIIEEDTTISLANTTFEKLSGYSKKEIEGKKSWVEFVEEKDTLEKMKGFHTLRRVNPDAAPRNYEFKFADKIGAFKYVLATVAMIPGTKKSIGSFLDITNLKRTQEAIYKSEKSLRNLIEYSLTGISIVQDDRAVFQNTEQEKLFGPLPRKAILADLAIIHLDDVEKVKQFYHEITSGKVEPVDLDFRFYPSGPESLRPEMKWVYCRVSCIEYQGKDALLTSIMDLTQAKELERLLMIQDKMSSLGRVAAGIAHEIRNPLSGINVYLNTLEKIYNRGQGIENSEKIIKQMQSASGRIESVIRRVMDFSRPSEPRFVSIDINTPIREAIELSSVSLRKRGIKIETYLGEDLQQCRADSQLTEQLVLNLITNAAEAMKNIDGEKRIEIRSSIEKDYIVVSISDSGPGVPVNIRDKIFDPFFSTKNDSTGIGLSIAQRIVTDHGGSLTVSQSKRGGAEFTIKIPIKKSTH
jgi:PAS domain S-box-containing protein